MKSMKWLHMVAFLLVVVGSLNWGLVALLNVNVVNVLFGSVAELEKAVYVLVALSGLYLALTHVGDCKACAAKK